MRDRKGFFKGLITGIVLVIIVMFVGNYVKNRVYYSYTDGTKELSGSFSEIEQKLVTIQAVIDTYFMSDEEIDVDALIEGIYEGYVDALDEAYTVYYTSEEYEALLESTSGTYTGIGVIVSQNVSTGVITVIRPFDGSPSAEAGILKDDIIYTIDGNEVTGVDINEVVTWIKGEEGTTVSIEVYRASENAYLTFEVTRKSIEIPMVEYEMLDNNIGYVAIYEFEETTYDQFDTAINTLTEQGMEALIIDLRDNPGGLVTSAVNVLDRILESDKLLVYTMDKNGDMTSEYYSEDDDIIDVPMVVLINENSASASEIVSGCLQDYEAVTLVGSTSYGKGIVQYVISLGDGSAIKLTSAKYYTPSGRNIHGIGIEPDVEVELDTQTDEDDQLVKAIEVLTGQLGE